MKAPLKTVELIRGGGVGVFTRRQLSVTVIEPGPCTQTMLQDVTAAKTIAERARCSVYSH